MAGKEGFDTDEKKSVGLQGLADAIKGVFNKSKETFLSKEENLSDIDDRQVALNNITEASTDNAGKILYVNDEGNAVLVDRYEKAGGVQTNELHTHDCRYNGKAESFQPIMKFILLNNQEKFSIEFCVQSCDNVGGPVYNSRYCYQHSTSQSKFNCVYSEYSEEAKITDVIAIYSSGTVTFYKRRRNQYDYFINIVYATSTNGYFISSSSKPIYYVGNVGSAALKEYEQKVESADFIDVADTSSYPENAILPTILQSDWEETDEDSLAYIKNKPEITSTTPDWNENDETSSSYIKNRTHYKSTSFSFVTSNPTSFKQWYYSLNLDQDTNFPDPDDYSSYTVDVKGEDNVEIIGDLNNVQDGLPITIILEYGNANYVYEGVTGAARPKTTECFALYQNGVKKLEITPYNDYYRILIYGFSDSNTEKIMILNEYTTTFISVDGTNIKQLDSQFIPIDNTTITINDEGQLQASETPVTPVTPDWNASEGESGYIENRTHYIYNDGGEVISFIQNDFGLDWNDDLGYYQLSDTAWSYIDQGSGVPTNTSTVSMIAGYTNEEGTYTELCSGNYIPFTDSEIGDDYWCIGYKMSEMWDVEQWFQIRYVKTCGAKGDYQVIIAFNDKQGQVYGDSLEFSVNCQFWENLYKKLDSNFIDIDNETITVNDEGKLQASGTSVTPDWNSSSEEDGYIKNRICYSEFEDNSDYADVENIEPGSYAFGLQLKDGCYYDVYINDTLYSNVLCYSYEDGGTTYFDIDIETIIEDGNYYWEYVEGTSDGTFTFIDDYGKYGDNIEFLAIQGKDEYVMKAIDDKYINIEEYTDDELTSLWTGNEIDNAEIDG